MLYTMTGSQYVIRVNFGVSIRAKNAVAILRFAVPSQANNAHLRGGCPTLQTADSKMKEVNHGHDERRRSTCGCLSHDGLKRCE